MAARDIIAIFLRKVEEASLSEIVKAINLISGTVSSALSRGKKKNIFLHDVKRHKWSVAHIYRYTAGWLYRKGKKPVSWATWVIQGTVFYPEPDLSKLLGKIKDEVSDFARELDLRYPSNNITWQVVIKRGEKFLKDESVAHNEWLGSGLSLGELELVAEIRSSSTQWKRRTTKQGFWTG
jgi:hypothetical protein